MTRWLSLSARCARELVISSALAGTYSAANVAESGSSNSSRHRAHSARTVALAPASTNSCSFILCTVASTSTSPEKLRPGRAADSAKSDGPRSGSRRSDRGGSLPGGRIVHLRTCLPRCKLGTAIFKTRAPDRKSQSRAGERRAAGRAAQALTFSVSCLISVRTISRTRPRWRRP